MWSSVPTVANRSVRCWTVGGLVNSVTFVHISQLQIIYLLVLSSELNMLRWTGEPSQCFTDVGVGYRLITHTIVKVKYNSNTEVLLKPVDPAWLMNYRGYRSLDGLIAYINVTDCL